nr:C40 family peptidase [Paenibacillus hamazuiensis]
MLAASALAVTLLGTCSGVAMASSAATAQISSSTADRIVNTAESYIGKVKYVYGVRDPQRLIFDCSAFTQFVFAQNGIKLPWGSNAQAQYGKPVTSKANLQKGDLVMFSVSTPGHINHVGIYIGGGKMVHNHPGRGVEITDINSGFWQSRFIVGRHF